MKNVASLFLTIISLLESTMESSMGSRRSLSTCGAIVKSILTSCPMFSKGYCKATSSREEGA